MYGWGRGESIVKHLHYQNPNHHNPGTQVKDMIPGPLASHEEEIDQNSRDKPDHEGRQGSDKRLQDRAGTLLKMHIMGPGLPCPIEIPQILGQVMIQLTPHMRILVFLTGRSHSYWLCIFSINSAFSFSKDDNCL